MSVSIPSNYDVTLHGGLGVDVNAHFPGPLVIAIDKIPKIQIGFDKIQLGLDKVQFGIDPLEIKPIDFTLRVKEIPSIRMHLPADFKIGMAILGHELLTVRLCGEAQVITEPYKHNPCEVCGEQTITIDQVVTASGPAKK